MSHGINNCNIKVKVKGVPWQARCGPEGSRRFRLPYPMTFGTWRWWGCQPHTPAAFTPRKCSWYSFSLGAESTPGPWYGRKEYVTKKSIDTTGSRSRDRPTSSAAPCHPNNCNIHFYNLSAWFAVIISNENFYRVTFVAGVAFVFHSYWGFYIPDFRAKFIRTLLICVSFWKKSWTFASIQNSNWISLMVYLLSTV